MSSLHRVRSVIREWWPKVIVVAVVLFIFVMIFFPPRPSAEPARQMRSVAHLKQIEHITALYVAEEGKMPASLNWLIDAGYIGADQVESYFAVDDEIMPYWVTLDRSDYTNGADEFIISYDRSMYSSRSRVAACALSGECKLWSIDEFESLLSSPVNAGRELNLPRRSDATSMRTR